MFRRTAFSGCRQARKPVLQRMGSFFDWRWSRHGAQAMLSLRCLLLSQRWHELARNWLPIIWDVPPKTHPLFPCILSLNAAVFGESCSADKTLPQALRLLWLLQATPPQACERILALASAITAEKLLHARPAYQLRRTVGRYRIPPCLGPGTMLRMPFVPVAGWLVPWLSMTCSFSKSRVSSP